MAKMLVTCLIGRKPGRPVIHFRFPVDFGHRLQTLMRFRRV